VAELYRARNNWKKQLGHSPFEFCLTIHDAVLVQVRPRYVEALAGDPHHSYKGGLAEWAMCQAHPLYPTKLDGRPTGLGPYHLGIDVDVSRRWGTPISKQECRELGVPEVYGKD